MRFTVTATHIATKQKRKFTVDGDGLTSARKAAAVALQSGETIVDLTQERVPIGGTRRLKREDLTEFCLALGEFMSAGLSDLEALRSVDRTVPKGVLKNMVGRMVARAEMGSNMGANVEAEQELLGPVIVALVKQGSALQGVAAALNTAVSVLDREEQRTALLVKNLSFPAMSLVLLVVLLLGSGLFVIPMFEEQIEVGVKVNAASAICFGYSHLVREWWPVWSVGLVVYAYLTVALQRFREAQMHFFMRFFGSARKANDATIQGDFCFMMGVALSNNVSEAQALEMVAERFKGRALQSQIRTAAQEVASGGHLPIVLENQTSLPWMAVKAVEIAKGSRDAGGYLQQNAYRAYARAERHFGAFSRAATVAVMGAAVIGIFFMFLGTMLPMMAGLDSARKI